MCRTRSQRYKQQSTYPSAKSFATLDTELSSPLPIGAAATPGLALKVEGAEPSFAADLQLYQQ